MYSKHLRDNYQYHSEVYLRCLGGAERGQHGSKSYSSEFPRYGPDVYNPPRAPYKGILASLSKA